MTASPIIPLRKLAQNRRCYTRRAAPSRHAMSGARYSNHLHAEEAAGSLEALIRDYESRGRRLRVRTTTSAPNVLPIHHPACLRPARLVNRRCCKRGTRCTVSARRLAAPTPASPLSRLHRRHRRRHRRHRRRHRRHRRHRRRRRCYPTITGTSTSHLRTLVFPPWQHPDLAVFFDEALAASGDEVRSLCSQLRVPASCARACLRRSAARSGRPRTHARSSRAWPRHAIRTAYPLARC